MDATGTALFGNDGNYQYGRANLFPIASGRWVGDTVAGVFHRSWYFYRSYGHSSVGFRASAYGS
jgi:hypothetical protein